MIINHFGECYLLFCACVIFHELAHYIVAKCIHLKVLQINFGEELFAVHIGKLSLSPNMLFGSGVIVSEESLVKKTRKQMAAFFLAGIAANLVTAVVGMVLWKWTSPLYGSFVFWESVYMIVIGSIPYCPWDSDAKKIRLFWKKCRTEEADGPEYE